MHVHTHSASQCGPTCIRTHAVPERACRHVHTRSLERIYSFSTEKAKREREATGEAQREIESIGGGGGGGGGQERQSVRGNLRL